MEIDLHQPFVHSHPFRCKSSNSCSHSEDHNIFEIYHNNTRALQVAKDREHTHTGSRRANTFGAVNTSVLMHKFDVSPPGQIDAPEAIFEVNLHEYEFTNDRYGTEYVTSGRRALKISRTTQQWDHNL